MARLAVLLVLLLSACGPAMVQADVTRFTSLPPGTPGRSFTILPDEGQRGRLEFQQYADLVAAALAQRGWTPLPASGHADTVVLVHWGTESPVTQVWQTPSATAWGAGGPWWGGWYQPFPYPYYESHSRTLWPKWLAVEILDGPRWRAGERHSLFEGRAVTEGAHPSIAPTIPYLAKAVFDNFPGTSGTTVRVSVLEAGY
jgi:hypothetical protein